MRKWSWAIFLAAATLASVTRAEEPAAVPPAPKGSLVIIGGALRFGEPQVWSRVVELAGGKGARIAVFPTASGNPLRNGERVANALRQAGAESFVVPVALSKIDVDYRQAVADPQLVEQVRSAGGVYFIGGEQSRITKALYDTDGGLTPILEAVWEVYRRGGVIAGSSAGAAIMSQVMCRDARNVLGTLQNGVVHGKEIDRGLGFLDPAWFVDQHCLIQGRFARALVIMHTQGLKYGVGIDENTAFVVRNGSEAEVIGYKGAIVLDLSQATTDASVKGFNLRNARITYLDRGDSFNMKTLQVIPSPQKAGDVRLDPNAPDFKPYFNQKLFVNDILGNTAVVDLMHRLIDNTHSEALGLAFDGSASRETPTQGFEFRFYRAADSLGWYTELFGAQDYTVANIHLDIRPVEIVGPLYK